MELAVALVKSASDGFKSFCGKALTSLFNVGLYAGYHNCIRCCNFDGYCCTL